MGFEQDKYVNPRTIAIEKIFINNKEEIHAHLKALDLSFRDLAHIYKVNDRNVRRWCERLGIDPAARTAERRRVGLDNRKCQSRRRLQQDSVANPSLLSRKW